MSDQAQPVGPWRDPFESGDLDPDRRDHASTTAREPVSPGDPDVPTEGSDPPDRPGATTAKSDPLDRPGATTAESDPLDRPGATTAESARPDAPTAPRGPAAGPILLGVTCLFVAALVLLYQLTVLRVDWAVAGPLTVVGSGALLVLAGLLGLGWARRQR